MVGPYAHAKPFKRHRPQLQSSRIRFGRLIGDIRRKIAGKDELEAAFEQPLSRANRNFPGRSGPGQVWIAIPYTVAASAIAGRIISSADLKKLQTSRTES
jgi:aconitase A